MPKSRIPRKIEIKYFFTVSFKRIPSDASFRSQKVTFFTPFASNSVLSFLVIIIYHL
ncbi:MAG: DUF2905 family protein [Treponema sp.]|nr:DUF2905 family protein [Treponema sp.]